MTESTYTVRGMTCDHCVSAVASEVRSLTGVTRVVADLTTAQVRVVSDRVVDDEALRAAVERAGYEVVTRSGG